MRYLAIRAFNENHDPSNGRFASGGGGGGGGSSSGGKSPSSGKPKKYKSPAHESAAKSSAEALSWPQNPDLDAPSHKKAAGLNTAAAKAIREANTTGDERLERLAKRHEERAAWHRGARKKSAAVDRAGREEMPSPRGRDRY